MSIFKKDCPECAASNSIDAVRCRCGYCFDPEALAGADADAYAEEQSRLYQDYLGARIVQAEAELTVAREQAKADPTNTYQAAAALVAEQTLNALQAEMKQLTGRLPVKRAAAVRAPAPAAPRTPVIEAKGNAPTPTPTVARMSTPVPMPTPAAPVAAPSSHKHASAAQKPRVAESRNISPVIAHSAPATGGKLEANKTAETRAPAARKANRPAATSWRAGVRAEPHRAQPSAKPGAKFRNVQARKADAVAKSQAPTPVAKIKRALSSVVSALTPAAEPIAAPVPAAAAAPKATRVCPSCTAAVANDLEKCRCGYLFSTPAEEMPAISLRGLKAGKESTQDCPNCTATVAIDRERCSCGYTFSKPTEHVPALTLDATALAILTDGIKPTNASRRR